jgi:hypothetical protein
MKGPPSLFPRLAGKYGIALLLLFLFVPFFSACELYFGKLGGADETITYRPAEQPEEPEEQPGEQPEEQPGEQPGEQPAEQPEEQPGEQPAEQPEKQPESQGFDRILGNMSGVWYSHYGKNRLDGYRIGKFGTDGENFKKEMGSKLALFPAFDGRLYQGDEKAAYTPKATDYYIFYDDTVYGQNEEGEGGNGGWGNLVMRYAGIVRAVNVFNNDEKTGALIVQYFRGCAPTWDADIKNGQRPFFGMYYRVQDENKIQMANAVELANLYAGKKYYSETATLDEAIEKNNAVNSSEFISWGVVWPQEREP